MMLEIETDGGLSEFMLKPIGRKNRQGMIKKVALDAQGRQCTTALLTHDGICLGNGSTADLYEDEDGNSVEHTEVIHADDNGNILRNLPPTTGRPQRPVGPIQAEELLEHTLIKAYSLTSIAIAQDLHHSLIAGDIYRAAFRPRATVIDHPAYLLANNAGIFLLQCKPALFEFIRLDQPIALEDDFDDEDDLWEEWPMNAETIITGGEQW